MPAAAKETNLHHACHKDVVLKGVCIAIRCIVKCLEHIVMTIANVLPFVHRLRHNLHADNSHI